MQGRFNGDSVSQHIDPSLSHRSLQSENLTHREVDRTDILKLILYDLNSAIAPSELRLMAIRAAIEEFDHDDKALHDEELDMRADHFLLQKLSFAMSIDPGSDEVGYICAALEMVYRASKSRLAKSFQEVCDAILPLFVDMIRRPPLSGEKKTAEIWVDEDVATNYKMGEHIDFDPSARKGPIGHDRDETAESANIPIGTGNNVNSPNVGTQWPCNPNIVQDGKYPKYEYAEETLYATSDQSTTVGPSISESGIPQQVNPFITGTPVYQNPVTHPYEQHQYTKKQFNSIPEHMSAPETSLSLTPQPVKLSNTGTLGPNNATEGNQQYEHHQYTAEQVYVMSERILAKQQAQQAPQQMHSMRAQPIDQRGQVASNVVTSPNEMGPFDSPSIVPNMVTDHFFTYSSAHQQHDPSFSITSQAMVQQHRVPATTVTCPNEIVLYGSTSIGESRPSLAVVPKSHHSMDLHQNDTSSPDDEALRIRGGGGVDSLNDEDDYDNLNERNDGGDELYSGQIPEEFQQLFNGSNQPDSRPYHDDGDADGDENPFSDMSEDGAGESDFRSSNESHNPIKTRSNNSGQPEEKFIGQVLTNEDPFNNHKDYDYIGTISTDELAQNQAGERNYDGQVGVDHDLRESNTSEPDYSDFNQEAAGNKSKTTIKINPAGHDYGGREGMDNISNPFEIDRNLNDNSRGRSQRIATQEAQQLNNDETLLDYEFENGDDFAEMKNFPEHVNTNNLSASLRSNLSNSLGGDEFHETDRQRDRINDFDDSYDRINFRLEGNDNITNHEGCPSNLVSYGYIIQDDSHGHVVGAEDNKKTDQVRDSRVSTLFGTAGPSDALHGMEEQAAGCTSLGHPEYTCDDIFQFQEPRVAKSKASDGYNDTADRADGLVCPLAVRKVLRILRYFSRVLSAMEQIAQQSGLVDALLYQMSRNFNLSQDEDEIFARVDAIACVVNLACAEENKTMLVNHPGLLNVVINIANHDPIEEAREHAAIVLMNLAYAEENKVPMVHQENLLDTLVLLLSDVSPFTRRYASAALFTLACTYANTAVMARHCDGGILEALRRVLLNDPIDEARVNAAEALFNLARHNSEDTVETMGNHPKLLASLAHSVLTDYSADVRAYSARALEWLSADIHHPMQCHPRLLQALITASQWTKTTCVAEALKMQASLSENRRPMVQHPGLLDALATLSLLDGINDEEVKSCAISALERLSKEVSTRHLMVRNEGVITALTRAAFYADGADNDDSSTPTSVQMKTALKNLAEHL